MPTGHDSYWAEELSYATRKCWEHRFDCVCGDGERMCEYDIENGKETFIQGIA